MFEPESSTLREVSAKPVPRRWCRPAAGVLVLAGAFACGLWLGYRPASPDPAPAPRSSAIATLFASPVRQAGSTESPVHPQPIPPPSRTLRVRSTSRVSSGNARAGESVLFVTEHSMRTRTGEHVPAGALVEGVVARARPSSTKKPGSLVIEIRALHVGSQAIPLHALPYIPQSKKSEAGIAADKPANEADIHALGIRNQLKPNPEAVMPREAVIEFQLVEADSSENPLQHVPEPVCPLPAIEIPREKTPPSPVLRLPVPDAKPPATARRPRIAIERG